MMQIRAAVSRTNEPFPQLEDVQLEEPGQGEVRVKVVAAGICHTDVHFHGEFGSMFAPKPMVLGHEGAGVIDAVGPGVKNIAVGDHVVLSASGCGECFCCLGGRPGYCDQMIRLAWSGSRADGTSPISQDGARISGAFFGQSSFATYAIAKETTAIKVDDDLPLHLLGTLCCGFITGAGSVLEVMRIRPGQSIAVFGTGSVGFAAIMAARLAGAKDIVAVDIEQKRLDLALELGATHALMSDASTAEELRKIRPGGFEFSFITAQPAAVFDTAFACLATLGTAAYVIDPSPDWAPNWQRVMTRGIKFQGIIGGGTNPRTFIPMLIEYWRRGQFPFDRLITEFPFEDIGEAWEQFHAGTVIKPVLRM